MNEPANSSSTSQKKQILKAISGQIDPPPISRMYGLGVVFTALVVLLLPLLYFAVMAVLLGSLFALVQHSHQIFVGWPTIIRWGGVFSLLLLGFACLLGLVKPFFARSTTHIRPRTLRREAEPLLFEYIDQLCAAIGTRSPTEIHVTCDLNAAAEFRNGWRSIFNSGEVSLYIGLPMVAGLTLRQFTGVLAHELGHFTQRTAMWLENIVRRTNLWFYRAAYEKDGIDDWLNRQCSNGGLIATPCYLAQFVVWITRRVLLGLAQAGTLISCLMSRQMEFNADRCQVRTVGTRTHSATLRRMRELSLAHQISFRDIAIFFEEGRLPDDMVALVVANTAFITPKMKKKMWRLMGNEETGLFDSHPSDQDRIRAALADGSSGFIKPTTLPDEVPASVLFNRFDDVCKNITTQFLENALNQKLKPRMLHSVEKLLERQTLQINAAKALWRYFQTDIPLLRPLPMAFHALDVPGNPNEIALELKRCRERMMKEVAQYKRLTPRYRTAEETLFETIAAQALAYADLPFKPAEFHLVDTRPDVIADKRIRAEEGVATLAAKLLPFESEAGNRLSFALQLIHHPLVVRRIQQGEELQFEVKKTLPQAQFSSLLMSEIPSLRLLFVRLQAVRDRLRATPAEMPLHELVVSEMKTFRSRLVTIQASLGDRLYPFDHAQAETTLREYLLPSVPTDQDLSGLVDVAELLQSRLTSIQLRLFAKLAQAAERIERAIGLAPLPEPKQELDESA